MKSSVGVRSRGLGVPGEYLLGFHPARNRPLYLGSLTLPAQVRSRPSLRSHGRKARRPGREDRTAGTGTIAVSRCHQSHVQAGHLAGFPDVGYGSWGTRVDPLAGRTPRSARRRHIERWLPPRRGRLPVRRDRVPRRISSELQRGQHRRRWRGGRRLNDRSDDQQRTDRTGRSVADSEIGYVDHPDGAAARNHADLSKARTE